eukprot:jgi/Botrbrau1/16235/Bobra.0066s0021.1
MAALSDFGYEQYVQRERLLSKLVCHVLKLQPGDPPYEPALKHCLDKLSNHRFPDPSPSDVTETYSRLIKRLAQHAQAGKAKALEDLVEDCLQLPLSTLTSDVHYRLLLALYSLAHNPLKSNPLGEPEPAVGHSHAEPAQSDASPGSWRGSLESDPLDVGPRDGSWKRSPGSDTLDSVPQDTSSEESWSSDSLSRTSTLSDWDLDSLCDGTLQRSRPNSCSRGQDASFGDVTLFHDLETSMAEAREASLLMAHLDGNLLEDSRDCVPDAYRLVPPDSLAGRFVSAEGPHPGSPVLVLDEASIVLQALRVLRGVREPGPSFVYSKKLDAIVPAEGVWVASLSPRTLWALRQLYCNLGNMYRRMWDFAEKAVVSQGLAGLERSPVHAASPARTLAAFGCGLRKELLQIGREIAAIEALFRQRQRQGHAVSFILLESSVQGPVRKLQLLQGAVQGVQAALPHASKDMSSAESASRILEFLYDSLEADANRGGPQGEQEVAILLRLLSVSLQPLLQMMDAWLTHGRLDDPTQEFFLQPGFEEASFDVASPTFWAKGFLPRLRDTGDFTCPAFLKTLVFGVLTAGKSQIFLDARPAVELRSPPGHSLGDSRGDDMAASQAAPQPHHALRSGPQGPPHARQQQAVATNAAEGRQLCKETQQQRAPLYDRFLASLRAFLKEAGAAQHPTPLNLEKATGPQEEQPEPPATPPLATPQVPPTAARRTPRGPLPPPATESVPPSPALREPAGQPGAHTPHLPPASLPQAPPNDPQPCPPSHPHLSITSQDTHPPLPPSPSAPLPQAPAGAPAHGPGVPPQGERMLTMSQRMAAAGRARISSLGPNASCSIAPAASLLPTCVDPTQGCSTAVCPRPPPWGCGHSMGPLVPVVLGDWCYAATTWGAQAKGYRRGCIRRGRSRTGHVGRIAYSGNSGLAGPGPGTAGPQKRRRP